MSRIRLTHDQPLCTVEEAFTLLAQAKAFIDQPEDDVLERVRPIWMLKHRAALDASLVALEVATDTGDPHLLSAALEGAYESEEWGRLEREEVYATAAEEILPGMATITNVVRDCVRSDSADLRAAAAKGLGARALRALQGGGDPVDAEAARIVTTLMQDPDPDVRRQARKSLGGLAPPAWLTFFASDPLASRSAADAARLRAPLDAAAEALEKGLYQHGQAFEDAIAALPNDLAVPILESWMRSEGTLFRASSSLLDRWVLGDENGERVVRWIMEDHKEVSYHCEKVAEAVRRAPREQLVACCLRAARSVMGPDESETTRYALGRFLENAWPSDADRTPLLEIAFGTPLAEAAKTLPTEKPFGTRHDYPILKLAFAQGPGLEALKDTLIDIFVAGAPGLWASTMWVLKDAIATFQDVRLRACAEAQLSKGEDEATWALSYLTGIGHDPEVDPPILRTLTTAIQHPATRKAVLRSPDLIAKVKRPLRGLLTRDDLTPEELIEIATRAGNAKNSKEGFDFTDEEMVIIRTARVLLQDETSVAFALHLIPPFPGWTEKDHEFVTRALHRFGEDGPVTLTLAKILEDAASPALLPIAEELSRIATPHASRWVRRAVEACRPKSEEAR